MIVSKLLCHPQPWFSHLEAVYSQPLPPPHTCRGPQMQLWVGRHVLMVNEYPSFLRGPRLVCCLLSQFLAHWMGHGRRPIKTSWMNGQSNCNHFHWAKCPRAEVSWIIPHSLAILWSSEQEPEGVITVSVPGLPAIPKKTNRCRVPGETCHRGCDRGSHGWCLSKTARLCPACPQSPQHREGTVHGVSQKLKFT